MLKLRSIFYFCTNLSYFKCAEVVLSSMYHHGFIVPSKQLRDKLEEQNAQKNQLGNSPSSKEEKDFKDKKENTQSDFSNPYLRTILADKIFQNLDRLGKEQNIDIKVIDKFKDMFNPREGVQLKELRLQNLKTSQASRILQGKNSKGLLPLNLNSAMMKFLIDQIYEKEKNNTKLVPAIKASRVHHIVGTPGLGKTFKFLMIKHIHDFKIPQIIQKGIPKDSLFQTHFKFIYIHAKQDQKAIRDTVLRELTQDFKQVPQKVSKQLNKKRFNLNQFLNEIKNQYQQKGIHLKYIVDQVNELYDEQYKQRAKNLKNLRNLNNNSECPMIMVSSKNNPYLPMEQDPIQYAAIQSGSHQKFIKTIVDNEISATDRLMYSIECLIFELEKNGLSRSQAIEVVRQIQHIPMLTHLSFSKTIGAWLPEKDKGISHLQELLNDSQDAKLIVKSFKFLDQKKNNLQKQQKEMFRYFTALLSCVFALSIKKTRSENIRVNFEVKDSDNDPKLMMKQFKIVKKEIGDQKQNQLLHLLKDSNFFFTGSQGRNKWVYFSSSPIILSQIQTQFCGLLSITFISDLMRLQPALAKQFIRNFSGQFYEILISYIFSKHKVKSNSVNVSISNFEQDKMNLIQFAVPSDRNNKLPLELSLRQEQFKKTISALVGAFKVSNNYIRPEYGNETFDFLLTKIDGSRLFLFFVDTTISSHPDSLAEKQNKFVKRLLSDLKDQQDPTKKLINKNFKSLIEQTIKQPKIKQIDIFYYILRNPNLAEAVDLANIPKVNELEHGFGNNVRVHAMIGHWGSDFKTQNSNEQQYLLDKMMPQYRNIIRDENLGKGQKTK